MAFNVWYEAEDNQETLAAIKDANPDVVCLRELTPGFVKEFKKQFKSRYRHNAFHPRQGTWGAGIASKYRIRNVELFPGKPHRLPGLEADVNLGGKWVKVACLHLFPPLGKHKKKDGLITTMKKNQKLRIDQAKYLVSRYKNQAQPLLLSGDMNEDPRGGAIATFRLANIRRACDLVKQPKHKCGATYPGGAYIAPAFIEIDHILGRQVKFHSAQVIRRGNSDHYPVYAVFSLE